jgi:hypothetical protein
MIANPRHNGAETTSYPNIATRFDAFVRRAPVVVTCRRGNVTGQKKSGGPWVAAPAKLTLPQEPSTPSTTRSLLHATARYSAA